ncbi:UDP-2,3-diacylglucosamine diphosphatase [Thiohalomonas denitrificans]|uniref:UDP-2,3-diacylglucosamine hydrolase n=1 Tax=Thiohalomonas denitrificans TaxID=415747 RepID=A0A1G5QPD5_9GAMM|nr:UDP-2,3-diacylglucosamine diphosphatase [Thiohalomonas denitrificans]SCZ63705.1 UDP-2,3-diacylglucosamine hydrolase [Thiohalomonas denitrificans]
MASTLFISDLHLSEERPETLGLFSRFLQERAREASTLYILGDLFEVWLGDDLLPPGCAQVLAELKQLTDAGTTVRVMPGNRDFLLGEGFEQATGCELLQEPTRQKIAGTPTLLLHGDTLCTDDVAYQTMRHTLRDPAWIRDFLNRTPEERIAVARQLREKSREATGTKECAIMDVNAEAVSAAFREHRVERLIHGHTHRPARHESEFDGTPVERFVLGDWSDHAEILTCDENGCQLERFA